MAISARFGAKLPTHKKVSNQTKFAAALKTPLRAYSCDTKLHVGTPALPSLIPHQADIQRRRPTRQLQHRVI
jgi:hypothetical protein